MLTYVCGKDVTFEIQAHERYHMAISCTYVFRMNIYLPRASAKLNLLRYIFSPLARASKAYSEATLAERVPRLFFITGAFTAVRHYASLARRSSLMAQFDHIKEQYKNYILLFQVGDFYEIYSEDASN